MGAEDAVQHADTLLVLIAEHLRLIMKLYGNEAKPKAHHLFHVVDGMVHLHRLLSCFVTERKHKPIKRNPSLNKIGTSLPKKCQHLSSKRVTTLKHVKTG